MGKNEDQCMVSICCTTFNHGNFISQCLDGFLMQETSFNYEILIHDDASTDDTQQILERYIKKYPERIKAILRKENVYSKGDRSISVKYNFSRAKGKYIAFCEGDDYWTDPHKLQKQVDFLESNPEYVVTYHNAIMLTEKGEMIEDPKKKYTNYRDYSEMELMKGMQPLLATSCFRNVIRDYPEEILNVTNLDFFLTSLLGTYGKGKYIEDIRPAAYRIHQGGIWSLQDKEKKIRSKINTFYQMYHYYKRIGETEVSRFYRSKIRNHCKMQFMLYMKKGRFVEAGKSLSWYANFRLT